MDINSIVANEINKNATVNTFTKGMNTDTMDNLMPGDQYRLAKNLRIVTHNDSSNGELRLIEGAKDIDITVSGYRITNIIATTQIRDYGIAIVNVSNRQSVVQNVGLDPVALPWMVLRLDKNSSTPFSPTILFGPCNERLGGPVSLVTRYEDEDNVKLYIADGKHALMQLNITEPTNSTDIKSISSSTEHIFDQLTVTNLFTGSLAPAVVQYAYVLYNKYGKSSQVSPLSKLCIVTNSGNGLDAESRSGNGFQIQIHENRITSYNKIKLFRITYQHAGQDPLVDMIVDDNLPESGSYIYNDYGSSLMSLAYAEFLALSKICLIPKQIESKNDYLFAADILYLIGRERALADAFINLDFKTLYEDSGYFNFDYSFSPTWMLKSSDFISWELITEDNSKKSLRRNEVYRYGIVLYDKYENKWPVKFICDVRTPPIGNYTDGSLPELGIRFIVNVNAINLALGDYSGYFTGFEIVRCNRTTEDRYTITQGIIGRPLQCYKYPSYSSRGTYIEYDNTYNVVGEKQNVLCPSGFITTDRITVGADSTYQNDDNEDLTGKLFAVSSDDFVLFTSPEVCYLKDDIINITDTYKLNLQFEYVATCSDILNSTTIHLRELKNLNAVADGYDISGASTVQIPVRDINRSDSAIIPGLSFSVSKVKFEDGEEDREYTYERPSCNSLWINTRLFFILHEPLAYEQRLSHVSGSTYKHMCIDNLTAIYNAYDLYDEDHDLDWYYRTVNEAEMRKTIYNYINTNGRSFSTNIIGTSLSKKKCAILSIKDVTVPDFNQFAQSTTPTFRSNSTSMDGIEFIPWSVPTYYDISSLGSDTGMAKFDRKLPGDSIWEIYGWAERCYYPVSAVGKSLLVHLANGENWFNDTSSNTRNAGITLNLTVCNLRRTNTTPYGGFTDYARQHSIYYSYGNYKMFSGNTETINVFDGDCYIQRFRYNAAKTFYNPNVRYAPNMTTIYSVELESDIDISKETGYSSKNASDDYNMYIQDKAAALRGYTQTEPCYIANTAYNTNKTAQYFTGVDDDSLRDSGFDYRVVYSDQKSNNESVDSWLNFKSANYIDVDTRYGRITNLRLFKDALLFWQQNATGVLSVNERTIILDANDTNIILGNGAVLQRYDYLTTEYGMKPDQHADGQSNNTLYWWDGYKKEILSYAGGNSVVPMNKLKSIDNYINSKTENVRPTIAHDVKYNEMLFSVVGNTSLSYSEATQQFVSEYEILFRNKVYFTDSLVLAGTSKFFEWNKQSEDYTFAPYIKFVVNSQSLYNNVYDNMLIGANLYNTPQTPAHTGSLNDIQMTFNTPLHLNAKLINGSGITDREYEYRLSVPRAGEYITENAQTTWVESECGDRLRGRTMECELWSTEDEDRDFSLQYIITKYRKSWT